MLKKAIGAFVCGILGLLIAGPVGFWLGIFIGILFA